MISRKTIIIFLILLTLLFEGCSSTKKAIQLPTFSINPSPGTVQVENKTPTQTETELSTAWTNIPTSTIVATFIENKTLIPVTTTPSPTIGPTYTFDERNMHLLKLIETNGDCELPCYWGFTPGLTEWEEVQRWITYLGRSAFETSIGGNSLYSVEYQDTIDKLTFIPNFYVKQGILDFIMSQTIIKNTSPERDKLDGMYSIRSFMINNGIPSRVWIYLITSEVEYPTNTYLNLWLFYDQKGYAILYYGYAERLGDSYESCPNESSYKNENPLQFELFMQSINANRPIEDIYSLLGMKISGYIPLREATGAEIDEFYDQMINGGEYACISTPRDIWP